MRANLLPLFLFLYEELWENSVRDDSLDFPALFCSSDTVYSQTAPSGWPCCPHPQVLTLGGGTSVLRTKGQRGHIFTRIQNISLFLFSMSQMQASFNLSALVSDKEERDQKVAQKVIKYTQRVLPSLFSMPSKKKKLFGFFFFFFFLSCGAKCVLRSCGEG